jgi:hypothetical protein
MKRRTFLHLAQALPRYRSSHSLHTRPAGIGVGLATGATTIWGMPCVT